MFFPMRTPVEEQVWHWTQILHKVQIVIVNNLLRQVVWRPRTLERTENLQQTGMFETGNGNTTNLGNTMNC